MRFQLYRFVTALLLLLAGAAHAQAPGQRHVAMELVPETATPRAGATVTLAFRSVPQPGWHGYWKNGGDAGVETTLGWTLPAGVTAGPLRYPVPGRLLVAGLMNYVYERPWVEFVDLTLPSGLAAGTRLPVRVEVDYLVCTVEVCVPESQVLETALTVGDGAVAPATRARFDAWRRAMPRPLGSEAAFAVEGGRFRMAVPFPAGASAEAAYFFPLEGGAIDYAAPQTVARDGDRLLIETKAAPVGTPPQRLTGVLAIGEGQGFALAAVPGAVAAGAPDGPGWRAALLAFAGAVLGGLLLNVMPCVFPILSLKALSLARANGTERAARREALAYAAGVVLVCVALGGLLLAIRAGGAAAGWAFQLQDPRVVATLLVLTVAIALNLGGLFELPVPRFAGEGGTAGAFATGALAAFVATPCSGPFMGAALGAALVLPAAAALAVFGGLGLGIALPFLALGFVPALRRRLPRPGAWMATFRRVLALPMFATALALAWVLGRQAGVSGMTLGLAAALVAGAGLWWTGLRQARGVGAWWSAGIAAVLALAVVLPITPEERAAVAEAGAEPFSEARLAELRAQGRPVFAYFTADWCLSCKVNEAAAIDRAEVRDAFGRAHVAVLVGDWTDGDPALGRFIERHNRAGVPLYLWYAPGQEARVLPQLLTPSTLTVLPGGGQG
jgi:DsbC/DsbD-like thiol-disulfide interchange protein/cytochrome c biogenesis protein CcdA